MITNCVLQPWVQQLPWKLQSILFSSLRGPDQEYLVNIKMVSKWMRAVTQENADPSKPYMNGITLPPIAALYKELEHCPCHFVHHFLDGIAIIAYAHPSDSVSHYAADIHYSCAEEIFHFVPETPAIFWLRHRDKRDGIDNAKQQWEQHEQTAKSNFLDAVKHMRRATAPHAGMP